MIDKNELSMSLLNNDEMHGIQGGETAKKCTKAGDVLIKSPICIKVTDVKVVLCATWEAKCTGSFTYDGWDMECTKTFTLTHL